MDSPWPQIFGGCFVIAALFYTWLKWLNWRDKRRFKKMCEIAIGNKIYRYIPLLALLCLPLTGCDSMTPAERAAATGFLVDTATLARDAAFGPRVAKAKRVKPLNQK